jgi:serine protease AprX
MHWPTGATPVSRYWVLSFEFWVLSFASGSAIDGAITQNPILKTQNSNPPVPARKPKPTLTPPGQLRPAAKQKRELDSLHRSVLALPLIQFMADGDPEQVYPIIIDINWRFVGGRAPAKNKVAKLLQDILKSRGSDNKANLIDQRKGDLTDQYIFAHLQESVIRELVKRDRAAGSKEETSYAIYRIWPDFDLERHISKSIVTIKADAVRNAFNALGEDIVWAVMDSGVDQEHPHFKKHSNLQLPAELAHADFAKLDGTSDSACVDLFGHGTHVAGIIAGEPNPKTGGYSAIIQGRPDGPTPQYQAMLVTRITGMASKTKILSVRVLDENGKGSVSNIIAGIAHIQKLNADGRDIKVHGVNISCGYGFDPEWFACGHSPLCVEVDRLVKSGVLVVVSAGNTGRGVVNVDDVMKPTYLEGSINDPGNAQCAITVGATHREMPHTYGVSFFSSKGPTGDGRRKPDLIAPGERIISCAAGAKKQAVEKEMPHVSVDYIEDTGTSMAAPHVSGALAAFLSVRREYIGRPEEVKQIFLKAATDLGRDQYFQGYGLLDVMRAIQSV